MPAIKLRAVRSMSGRAAVASSASRAARSYQRPLATTPRTADCIGLAAGEEDHVGPAGRCIDLARAGNCGRPDEWVSEGDLAIGYDDRRVLEGAACLVDEVKHPGMMEH